MEKSKTNSQNRRKFVTKFKGCNWVCGEEKKSSGRRRRRSPRTPETVNKKLRQLKSLYNRLSKGEKFKSKYPTFESYLKVNPIKETQRHEEPKGRVVSRTDLKKKAGLWGIR